MMRFVHPRQVMLAYRSKLGEELRGEWAVVALYRPFSFVLAPVFIALGIPPTAITLGAMALAAALPWLALAASPSPFVWVAVAAMVFCVLDCVDGDVARVTQRSSAFGAYADFLADLLYRIFLYAAIGLLAGALAMGLAAALAAVLARCCRLYAGAAPAGRGHVVYSFLSGLDHLAPPLLLVAGYFDHADWLLGWVVLYSLGDFVVTQFGVLRRLH